jgi:hypothetical protein
MLNQILLVTLLLFMYFFYYLLSCWIIVMSVDIIHYFCYLFVNKITCKVQKSVNFILKILVVGEGKLILRKIALAG